MVFPKKFFENLNFEKISRQQKKTCKITQHVNSKDQPRHVPSVYEKRHTGYILSTQKKQVYSLANLSLPWAQLILTVVHKANCRIIKSESLKMQHFFFKLKR